MSNVRSYTDKQLLDRVKSLPSFKSIPVGRWIIGVRSQEDAFDAYDDKFYEFEGEKFIRVVKGTTNAGGKIIKGGFKSYTSKGVAVLKSDEWYYNVWQYGLHRGRMPALLQRGAEVKIYRDGDMDNKTEEEGEIYRGYFGINYHSNTYDFSLKNLNIVKAIIGGWSAGCQVINERSKYIDQMEWYKKAYEAGHQTFVSYVLLKEFDPS